MTEYENKDLGEIDSTLSMFGIFLLWIAIVLTLNLCSDPVTVNIEDDRVMVEP